MACRSNECRAGWRKRPSMSDVRTAVLRTEAAVVRVLSQKGPFGLSPLPGKTHPSAGTWCLHDRDHPRSSQSGRAAAAFAYEPSSATHSRGDPSFWARRFRVVGDVDNRQCYRAKPNCDPGRRQQNGAALPYHHGSPPAAARSISRTREPCSQL